MSTAELSVPPPRSCCPPRTSPASPCARLPTRPARRSSTHRPVPRSAGRSSRRPRTSMPRCARARVRRLARYAAGGTRPDSRQDRRARRGVARSSCRAADAGERQAAVRSRRRCRRRRRHVRVLREAVRGPGAVHGRTGRTAERRRHRRALLRFCRRRGARHAVELPDGHDRVEARARARRRLRGRAEAVRTHVADRARAARPRRRRRRAGRRRQRRERRRRGRRGADRASADRQDLVYRQHRGRPSCRPPPST